MCIISIAAAKSKASHTSFPPQILKNSKTKKYEIEEVAKEIYTSEKVIALNLGTELHIINKNGWLMKKYISQQEINNVVISDKIVGIIYRNKIEIIEL